MVRINENLIINESYIVKAEFSKLETDQVLTLLLAVRATRSDEAHEELVVRGSEAWALWEYLSSKADRC